MEQTKLTLLGSRILLTLHVKIVWFGCQRAVFVNKRHTNAIFGCIQFQKVDFGCLLLNFLFNLQKKLKTYLNGCTLCGLSHYFRDSNIFHPIFRPRVTKYAVKWEFCRKIFYLVAVLNNYFVTVKIEEKNIKESWR